MDWLLSWSNPGQTLSSETSTKWATELFIVKKGKSKEIIHYVNFFTATTQFPLLSLLIIAILWAIIKLVLRKNKINSIYLNVLKNARI